MAKAYNGKEISVLRSSRYSKELEPCKLDLRRIFHQWSSLGVKKPLLLGSGIEGEAWDIGRDTVLKIHRSKDKYLGLTNIPANPRIERLRPKVFSMGSFNPKLFWVIMERFDTFNEYDLDLDILIGEVSYYVEKTIDLDRLRDVLQKYGHSGSIRDTFEIVSLTDSFYSSVIKRFNSESDYPLENTVSIRDRHKLAYHWWPDFVRQIIYLHITDRADDLWLPNLGISRTGVKKGCLVFFDW